jgi:hypothetical protein
MYGYMPRLNLPPTAIDFLIMTPDAEKHLILRCPKGQLLAAIRNANVFLWGLLARQRLAIFVLRDTHKLVFRV